MENVKEWIVVIYLVGFVATFLICALIDRNTNTYRTDPIGGVEALGLSSVWPVFLVLSPIFVLVLIYSYIAKH